MKFNGDIIITDLCYIMRDDESYRDMASEPKYGDFITTTWDEDKQLYLEQSNKLNAAQKVWEGKNPRDIDVCDYGYNMKAIGIPTSMVDYNDYGDWSCTTYDKQGNKLGEFCADEGMVGVFLLEEVLKYNPDFDYHLNREWTTTWIKGFKGEVIFHRVPEDEGGGVRSAEGIGNINFITEQTGL